MDILLAAMAFSVLMVAFSTAVTGLTETYLRITAVRARVLAETILKYLKEDPNIKNFVKEKAAEADERLIKSVQNALTVNPARREAAGTEDDMLLNLRGRVDTLSTYSFLQRLARTDLGKSIAEKADAYVLRGLTMSFERYVAASNEVFRKHAKSVTLALSIVFAFALNIDAMRLYTHLLDDTNLRDELIDNAEAYGKENEAAIKDLEAALANLEEAEVGELEKALENTTDAAENLKAITGALESDLGAVTNEFDLPIGYEFFPWADKGCPVDTVGTVECQRTLGAYLLWFAQVLLAGILIGLGGPFWYRVFTSLSHVAQLLRNFKGSPRPEAVVANDTQQPASQKLVHALNAEDGDDELVKLFRVFAGLPVDADGAKA